MSAQDDSVQGYALGVVFGIVGLVVAGVIALACATVLHKPAAAVSGTGSAERVYFEVGQDSLPVEANEVLARVADAARENNQTLVLIAGFHDASGDAAANANLAQRRALRVRHALEANGVAPAQLVLSKPSLTTGRGGAREARRVEISLQTRD